MTIDVFPGLSIYETQLVWPHTNYITVLGVQTLMPSNDISLSDGDCERESCRGSNDRAWILAEWMKAGVVDDFSSMIEDEL